MQASRSLVLIATLAASCTLGFASETNPLGKVLDLLAELTAKITKEGEAEAKAYKEYFAWCDDTSKNAGFEIKTATAGKEQLEAKIGELISAIDVSGSKIEELAADTATDTAELKNATLLREKEFADFSASEAELMDVVDTLDRAIGIISKEMQKHPGSFAQLDTSSERSLLTSLSVVIDAAGFSVNDQKKLFSLVQSRKSDEAADDQEPGAPDAAAYKSHSSGILDVLEDMKEKAEIQLSELRKAETSAKHNYDMLKQSLEDQMAADTKDMEDEKAAKAEAEEGKATAEGELETTIKSLKDAQQALETASTTCMTTAADHEATVKAREEELKVIAEATKILQETSGGAVEQAYSLLQVGAKTSSRMTTRADLAGSEVIVLVKRLAKEHHSAALAQLASRISAVVRYGAADGEDPFVKVKGLIQSLIDKLEKEAADEATEKAYCDEEMSKTEAKKSELEDDVSKLTAKIDQATAKSAKLTGEVQQLEAELAALMKEQAQMDKIRQESHADYVEAKSDLELGLTGVRKALGVLRDYYATGAASMVQAASQQPAMPEKFEKATGAGTSIIGILEVVESDFATSLSKEETQEADAQSEYDTITQENKVTKTIKDTDLKYKNEELKSLAKAIAELSGDKETTGAELSAVNEYYAKLRERCIAKPETYEERKIRRESEIKGLKEALTILENETAFVQRKTRHGHIRGSLTAH